MSSQLGKAVSATKIQRIFDAVYEANKILYREGRPVEDSARCELGKALKILRQLGGRP
jgi:hypothetical protein